MVMPDLAFRCYSLAITLRLRMPGVFHVVGLSRALRFDAHRASASLCFELKQLQAEGEKLPPRAFLPLRVTDLADRLINQMR